jgi:hypothetical protein
MGKKIPRPYRPFVPIETWSSPVDHGLAEALDNDAPGQRHARKYEARQAIFNALHALAPTAIERLAASIDDSEGPDPAEIDQWGREHGLVLGTAVWDIFVSCSVTQMTGEPLQLNASPWVSGVRLNAESGECIFSARINPQRQTQEEARRAVLDSLDHELGRLYAEERKRQGKPFKGRSYLTRNAERLILRQVFNLRPIDIVYYEEGRRLTLPDGTTLKRQEREGQFAAEFDDEGELNGEDSEEGDISQQADKRRTWEIEKSVTTVAEQAGIGLLEKPRGRRSAAASAPM